MWDSAMILRQWLHIVEVMQFKKKNRKDFSSLTSKMTLNDLSRSSIIVKARGN